MKKNDEDDKPVFMISVAAGLTGMHPQTLRIYERKKLVEPGRTAKSTRLYSQRDIRRLKYIQQLTQQEGVNLAGVKIIIDLQRQVDDFECARLELETEIVAAKERMADEVKRARRKHRYELVIVPKKRELMKR